MNSWKIVVLGELVDAAQTWNPSRSKGVEVFDYIDLSAVDQATKLITGARQLSCHEAPSRARQLVATDDILVSTVRPNLNAVARVPKELDGATASTGFCVLRPRRTLLHHSYLFHWVKSPTFVSEMVRKATGASYPAVSDRIILESRLPLPPAEEQRRIAHVLDRAEALRAKRRAALAQLDGLRQAIFRELFGDPRDSRFVFESLSDCAEVVSGVTKGRRLDGRDKVLAPYLRVANVQAGYLDLHEIKTIEALPSEVTQLRLRTGDLLLTEGGDFDKLGRGAMWEGEIPDCIHQNHVFRVRVDASVLAPRFLHEYLQTSYTRAYFLRCAKRTTNLASINMTQLRGLPVLLPPLALQHEFAGRLVAVEKLKAAHLASLAEMDALFASLQHRAFRGEL
jgi:type I restriction enzyme S subunit